MKLAELIDLLQNIQNTIWGETNVFIRDYEQGRYELFGILPEKDEEGHLILVLE